jgi:hypothetical protein
MYQEKSGNPDKNSYFAQSKMMQKSLWKIAYFRQTSARHTYYERKSIFLFIRKREKKSKQSSSSDIFVMASFKNLI